MNKDIKNILKKIDKAKTNEEKIKIIYNALRKQQEEFNKIKKQLNKIPLEKRQVVFDGLQISEELLEKKINMGVDLSERFVNDLEKNEEDKFAEYELESIRKREERIQEIKEDINEAKAIKSFKFK